MNFEKVWLEKVLCVLLQAEAVPEQSSGEKEKEEKAASEMENRVGRFWKRRKDVRKERRRTSRVREDKERLVAISEEQNTKTADCNMLSAEINYL